MLPSAGNLSQVGTVPQPVTGPRDEGVRCPVVAESTLEEKAGQAFRVVRGADWSEHREVASVDAVTDPSSSGLDPARGHRNEFGELERQSGLMLNELSNAQIAGAENLLTKAIRALDSGDDQRAGQLIQRAAQMACDPREEGSPGVRAATLLVYDVISGQFEASDPDDMTWLDVALEVHPGLDPTGRAEVESVVHGFVLQGAFFDVSAVEKRRIREVFGDAPLEAELGDGPNSTLEQRQDIIRSLILAAMALNNAYAAVANDR